MKYFVFFLFFGWVFTSCDVSLEIGTGNKTQKTVFTKDENKILQTARKIIDSSYYTTLITRNRKGMAKARVMEPFAPEPDFTIYMATNPKSRKIKEIQNNRKVTLHYFDRNAPAYVSLYGTAELVDNDSLKQVYWKQSWKHFYKNRKDAYILIRFIPDELELISIPDAYTGDSITWKPASVNFIEN